MTKAKLTEGSIKRIFVRMTLPMLGGIYAMITIFLVDTYFISRLGTTALAAVSFTFPVTLLLIHFVMGIGIGTASVVSRAIGSGDREKCKRNATDGILLSLILVCVITFIGLKTIYPLFSALGAQGETLELIHAYMEIWYYGIAFVVVPMIANNIIRATGDAKYPGIVMMCSAVLNLILDPLLIFGYWGFPAYGIRGAAIATCISFTFSTIATLCILHFRDKIITYHLKSVKDVFESWKEILYIGLPAASTNVIIHMAFIIVVKLLSVYGEEAVAGFGVATRVETFALAVYFALSSIVGPFVGQNWGAKKFDRVQKGLRYTFIFSLVWGLILAVIITFIARPVVALFDQDKYVVYIATLYLYIVPWSYGAEGIIMMTTSTFNALGKPFPSAIISLTRMFLLYIPLAIVGRMLLDAGGIFTAAFLANIIMGYVAYKWNISHRKKRNAQSFNDVK